MYFWSPQRTSRLQDKICPGRLFNSVHLLTASYNPDFTVWRAVFQWSLVCQL